MSYRIGLDTLHLRPTPRLAHTEYCWQDDLARRLTGRPDACAFTDLAGSWEYDFLWQTHDGPIDWARAGRVTRMGHAEFVEQGADFDARITQPFTDPEQVYAFDAVEEYGLPAMADLVRFYQQYHDAQRARAGDLLLPGGYYRTIISGAIDAFGWDLLLESAADLSRFEPVLDSFFRRTLYHVKAWAQTSIEAFIQHDDFVWSSGPFMDPSFYRKAIIPRYAELWKVLHAAGKKVLFCSDANWSMFVADIAQAGADGFIFEPMLPLEPVVRDYGKSHVIVGSQVDCRTMTFGSLDQVRREVDATLALAADCPGFVFAVGNHIPANVPPETAQGYMDYLRANWSRR